MNSISFGRSRVVFISLLITIIFGSTIAPDHSFAQMNTAYYWGGPAVNDQVLNRLNGTKYTTRLNVGTGKQYACVGYAEWAINRKMNVKPRMPNYPLVWQLRRYMISKGNPIVAYGSRLKKSKGGSGKFRTYGEIRPGDVVFFYERRPTKYRKRITLKALKGTRKQNHPGNYKGVWQHVAIIGGKGTGINAKLHHNNSIRNIHFGESIKYYLTKRDCTDYQVFRVLGEEPPAKVVIRKATAKTNSITVRWKKAKKAKKYLVQYKGPGTSKWITIVKGTKRLTVTKKRLKANTRYRFRVRAVAGKQKGEFSKIISIKTKAKPKTDPVKPPKPEPKPDPKPEPDPDPEAET